MTSFKEFLMENKEWGHELGNRLEHLINKFSNEDSRNLKKNDSIHSKSIENILNRLVPDQIKETKFQPQEIFLLLAATYLHDIGRSNGSVGHEEESSILIMKNYSGYSIPNEFIAQAIAQICAAHADEKIYPINRCDDNFGIHGFTDKPINLRRLAALFRIADELDNSYLRVSGIIGQENSIRKKIRDVNPVPMRG